MRKIFDKKLVFIRINKYFIEYITKNVLSTDRSGKQQEFK